MTDTTESSQARSWMSLASLTPLLVLANDAAGGLILGLGLLATHSAAAATSLLVPTRLGESRVFWLSALAGAAASSLCASTLRLIDPFLYEAHATRLFLTAFILPVMSVCAPPRGMEDRELTLDQILRGLGYAAVLAAFGVAREFLSTGAVGFGLKASIGSFLPIAGQPAGAFMLLGLLAAGIRAALGMAGRSAS